jgi:hypothetical protein
MEIGVSLVDASDGLGEMVLAVVRRLRSQARGRGCCDRNYRQA